jgi:CHASE2 domain-containing sensor protein
MDQDQTAEPKKEDLTEGAERPWIGIGIHTNFASDIVAAVMDSNAAV